MTHCPDTYIVGIQTICGFLAKYILKLVVSIDLSFCGIILDNTTPGAMYLSCNTPTIWGCEQESIQAMLCMVGSSVSF